MPGDDPAAIAEPVECDRHGAAAHLEYPRDLAFGRQPDPDRDPSLEFYMPKAGYRRTLRRLG